MITIKKEQYLNIDVRGKNLIIYDLPTLCVVLGTTSVSGNLKLYGVTKEKTNYVLPISKLKERIEELSRKVRLLDSKVRIMQQILEV